MALDDVFFSVSAERPVVRDDQESEIDVAVELVTSKAVEAAATNYSLNLCIVLDRSGSMGGEKIEQAKKSCADIFDSLNPTDRFTVLAFDDDVVSVVNPQTPRNAVKERLRAIEPGGQTDLSKGWYLGLLELQTYSTENHINRLILLSDGQANKGEQKPSVLGEESRRAHDELRITTSTIGIGIGFQEDILVALARNSGGRFWFIGEARIEDIIKEEFSGALSILLERPSVTIELPPELTITQELNDLPKIAGRYRLRPIKANDQYGVAIRIGVDPAKIPSGKLPIRATLFDGEGVVKNADMVLTIGTLEEYARSPEDTRVAAIATKYRAAKSEEDMLKRMDDGDVTSTLTMLKSESTLKKELEAKLTRASTISWDDHSRKHERERARELEQIRMEIAENETLVAVAQLIDLMKGLGQVSEAGNLMLIMRKMTSQSLMRNMGQHSRSESEDWAPQEVLLEAKAAADKLVTDFPYLKDELVAVRAQLDAQLAQFSS